MNRDYVMAGGVRIPPTGLRRCGTLFKGDREFLDSGVAEARRLVDRLDVSQNSRILDIGCGPGRLPIGLAVELGAVNDYLGIDLDQRSIDWCQRHITSQFPSYRFLHVNVRNERYNPDGVDLDQVEIPAEEDSFDVAYSHSVLFALSESDVGAYARLFRRVLRPQGRVFLTAFVEEGVEPVAEGFGYVLPRGVRQVTLWDKSHLAHTFEEAGLTIDEFLLHSELDGQAGLYMTNPL